MHKISPKWLLNNYYCNYNDYYYYYDIKKSLALVRRIYENDLAD